MAKQTENESAILFPDQTITLGGEKITVREFYFLQEMEALPLAMPIINDLARVFGGDDDPGFTVIEQIFYQYQEAFFSLLSMATGKPAEWIKQLKADEGPVLGMTFWSGNRRFFISRVVTKAIEQDRQLAEKLSAPAISTPP